MIMSIFGWDYPPGCSSVPGDEEFPCSVCGQWMDDCICPECPVCGEIGNPDCYGDPVHDPAAPVPIPCRLHHGLHRTREQYASMTAKQAQWAQEAQDEYHYWLNPPKQEEAYPTESDLSTFGRFSPSREP